MRKPIQSKKECRHKIVMIIDDSELDNIINQKIIEGNHFAEVVYVNSSAMGALEMLKNLVALSSISNQLMPAYIFLDLNMPMMDGFQFMELYFKQYKSLSNLPKLVILTSSININDKEKVKEIDPEIPFLNKPLTKDSLLSLA
jgi:CheY-like chemotaxis protein